MSSRARRRPPTERLPSPPPTPPLPAVDSSTSTPYSSFGRLPTNEEYHSYHQQQQHQNQFVIGKDLCRAIKELRAVPSLRWPARNVEFSEYNADIDDDDDSVFDEGDVRRRRLDSQKDWRSRVNNNTSTDGGDVYYKRVVGGGSESSSNMVSSSSIRTSSGGAAGDGISDLERASASRYSGNYVTVTIGQHISSDGVMKFQRNSDAEKVISVDQKTVYTSVPNAPSHQLNTGADRKSRTVLERHCQESVTTQLTRRSGMIVDGDVVWNNGRSSNDAQDTTWQCSNSKQKTVAGAFDEASANLRLQFGEDDIYERQMEELERAAVTECVDDCETDFMFESSVGGDVGLSSERLLAASFSVDIDEKRSTSGSSCSNLSSSGVDVVNHDVDCTTHSDEVGSNECWEDSVSEKERFVRSVLTRRDASQVDVEINQAENHVDTVERLMLDEEAASLEAPSNGFQTVFASHSRVFERELDARDVRQTTANVLEGTKDLESISEEDAVVLSSFEQTSTKLYASDPTIESTSSQINGTGVKTVSSDGLSQQNQLSYKPALIKTIALTSFVTTSSGDTAQATSTANNGSVVNGHSLATKFSNVASVDFTAEELFEEIMESLNDEADENDEDLFDRFSPSISNFQFTTSSHVIQTASVGHAHDVSPAKENAPRGVVEQRGSELTIASKEEGQRVVEPNFEEVFEVSLLESKIITSSSFTELQQSRIDIEEKLPGEELPGDEGCWSRDVKSPSTTVVVCDDGVETVQVAATADDAVNAAAAEGRLVLDFPSADTEPVGAEHVADDDVEEVVSPSVKSLTSFFERKPVVVVSSSPRKFAPVFSDENEHLVHEETDVDFESVVKANVDEDDDFSLDNMVGLNFEEVDITRLPMRSSPVKPQSVHQLHHQTTQDGFRTTSTTDRETSSSSSEHRSQHQIISEDLVESNEVSEVVIDDERLVIGMKSSGGVLSDDVIQSGSVFDQASGIDLSNADIGESRVNDDSPPHFENISKEKTVLETEVELDATNHLSRDVSSNDAGEICVRGAATVGTLNANRSDTIEIVSDQLTTQEIVLTIKLPRIGRKTKTEKLLLRQPGTDVILSSRNQSEECNAMARTSENSTLPFRHLHVRRVVRVIDAEGSSSSPPDDMCLTSAPSRNHGNCESEATKNSTMATTISGSSATAIYTTPLNDHVDDVISGERAPPRPVISVEFDRKSRSSAVEYVTTAGDDGSTNEVSVVREDAVRVVRLPGCSADSVRLPVLMSVGEAIDGVAHALQRALSTVTDASIRNDVPSSLLPGDVRVTCEAFERTESLMTSPGSQEVAQLMTQPTSEFSQSSVTVVSRTLWPLEPHVDGGMYDVIVQPDDVTSGCRPTVTSFV